MLRCALLTAWLACFRCCAPPAPLATHAWVLLLWPGGCWAVLRSGAVSSFDGQAILKCLCWHWVWPPPSISLASYVDGSVGNVLAPGLVSLSLCAVVWVQRPKPQAASLGVGGKKITQRSKPPDARFGVGEKKCVCVCCHGRHILLGSGPLEVVCVTVPCPPGAFEVRDSRRRGAHRWRTHSGGTNTDYRRVQHYVTTLPGG